MGSGGGEEMELLEEPHPKQELGWESAGTGLLVASTLLGHSDSQYLKTRQG